MEPDRTTSIGISLTPESSATPDLLSVAELADEAGLDFIGIQDHPYQRRFLDTFALIGVLLGRTKRISIFPDVANLPLRPPALLAKTAASLDLLSGGRFELGLGAGSFWDGVVAMGGPRRSPGESVDALEEAIEIIRAFWSGDRALSHDGTHYALHGVHPGPQPAHPIGIYLGAYKPRMLALLGRAADGWLPSLGYADPEQLREGHRRIDDAAAAAGRDPRAIRRLVNVSGTITAPGPGDTSAEGDDQRGLSGGPAGPPSFWTEMFEGLRGDGFDSFVFWPKGPAHEQVERLAADVAPALRA